MIAFLPLGGIGIWELLIVVLILVLLFGARKIPALARALGQSFAEFRKGRHEGASAPPAADKKSSVGVSECGCVGASAPADKSKKSRNDSVVP